MGIWATNRDDERWLCARLRGDTVEAATQFVAREFVEFKKSA